MVQFRCVRLMWDREWLRGRNPFKRGLNWRSTQKGQIQSRFDWIASVFSSPLKCILIPMRMRSFGRAEAPIPLTFVAASKSCRLSGSS